MRRLPVLIAISLGLLAAGCGGGGGGTTSSTTPRPAGTATKTTTKTKTITTTSAGIGGAGTVEVFFVDGERLKPVQRTVPRQAPAKGAMRQLLQGPSGTGLGTAIPTATELNGVHIEGGIAKVDLSKAFESGGGSLSMHLRVAQVVYTLTQFSSASLVRFYIEGRPAVAIGGEGLILDRPVGRAQFSEFAC